MKLFDTIKDWFVPQPMHRAPLYGRGIHALPNPDEKELFDRASEAFVSGDILSGYECFLSSIVHQGNGISTPHLSIVRSHDSLTFTLYQGYALIKGFVTETSLEAHADIAVSKKLHVATKRRFLERDFQLTYCRFSDAEGTIKLSIRLDNATITPQKIFYPLREIALNADFEKEFIAGEFDESVLLDTAHLLPIEREKIDSNYAFMHQWINETRQSLIGLLSNDNTGMTSFSYLALLLQIDYLLLPHKKMAKNISEKINGYFMDDEKLTEDKNADLEQYLSELGAMDIESFSTQFYDAAYTFSPFEQAMHDEIAAFIDESLGKVRWYKNNRSTYVIPVIYRYISLYILYNYGLHPSLRALLHLHVEIYASEFFKAAGETPLYDPHTKTFKENLIAQRIRESIEPYMSRYKGLSNFSEHLNYSDLDHFSQSFYLQVKNLDYTEV
ncbi:hypothetical protein Sulku_1856 [Sulfuricurvum kujiense DSM 16994]|uniref:Uncharacterized protein n=1 Tax=Sulfuricurvum kujiense (strain ATCC BAA-921 / DSM 16994 / JCM 11577 / YK-1) TaxID=709032 RepID=E4U1P3_SULKY|nr:hypothetical protein [Sulfuricurvum kujiense]ADR34516.1 hypothetical protein Sulku_1856 [Sulfuricurvum kujiense DSM 16994]